MTFEETEKRRADALAGPGRRRGLGVFLFVVFLGLTAALLYLIAAPYVGQLGNDYAATAGVGGLGGAVLLGLRFVAYRRAHSPAGALSLAFLDVLAWVGVVGVLIWSFVFPILNPFPPSTVLYLFYLPEFPIGVYSLTFVWAMLIVLRVVLQPFTKPPSDRVYADIESSLRKLTETVNQVGRLRGADQKADPGLADKVSTIISEITAVRKELSTIKTSAPAPYPAGPGAPGLRVVAPPPKQVVVPKEQAAAARPSPAEGVPAGAPGAGISTPESTVDNPWLDVLSRRRAKKGGGAAGSSS
jgi:hypothetical protein